ncbi:MAG TPA: Cof-type HAD-IIB family hydrolase [Symbiobacteriaceae bacterium]|nr:Cof-type HAD-IIB family hydrolase [Symbiobacteriaceae bacterium]
MPYRLIALDLDGTLLTSRHEITPRTREALRAARERGIVATVATGRSPHSARLISRDIGGGPIICCNGAAVYDEAGNPVSIKPIPQAPLLRCLEVCIEAGLLLECYTELGNYMDRPVAHMLAYKRWFLPRLSWARGLQALARIWRRNHVKPVRNLLKWAEQPDHPKVLKVMVVGEAANLGQAAARLGREVPGLSLTSSGRENIEVMAAGVNKGHGLQMLAARLKIPREALIAFGDSDNDLEMLTYAGTGVAMGNANDAAKAAAARVTGTNNEDGVAAAIEEMCLS